MNRETGETAIRLHNLGHAYQPGAWIFRGYDATIRRGSIVSLLGRNGCGKTTLLNLILRLMRPAEGTVKVHGDTAYVPQSFHIQFSYSVLDVVIMGRAGKIGLFAQPGSHDRELCLEMLDRFGLAEMAGRPFADLSGGQRQMVLFARALVSQARTVVLDEPTSALDLRHQNAILDWMQRLAHDDRLTIIFTTHHFHHAYAIADEAMLMLRDGSLLHGDASDILTENNLSALYEVPIQRTELWHASRPVATLVPLYLGRQKQNCRINRQHRLKSSASGCFSR